jgi:hypothetical protein
MQRHGNVRLILYIVAEQWLAIPVDLNDFPRETVASQTNSAIQIAGLQLVSLITVFKSDLVPTSSFARGQSDGVSVESEIVFLGNYVHTCIS